MKETILDVLLYLFENYFYDDPDAVRDRESLPAGLFWRRGRGKEAAGFNEMEIDASAEPPRRDPNAPR